MLSPKCNSVEEFSATEIISQRVQDEDVISPKCKDEDEFPATEIEEEWIEIDDFLELEETEGNEIVNGDEIVNKDEKSADETSYDEEYDVEKAWQEMIDAVVEACEEDDEIMRTMLMAWDCERCGEELKMRMQCDCAECGQGIGEEELHQTLIGLDVVGLFPAMKSENTGRIVRKRFIMSKIKIEGFDWRHGLR